MKKSRLNLIISLAVGTVLFVAILFYYGPESFKLIFENINPLYLIPYVILTTLDFATTTFRLKIILKAHGQKVGFLTLFRQNLAGFSISYVTPSVRVGGEPLKAYMLKQECDIDLKTGSSSIILDKFVELFGSAGLGIIGLALLFTIPGITITMKTILSLLLITAFSLLGFIYYSTIRGKGPFTNLFNLLKFYKFKRLQKFDQVLKEVEDKMGDFFKHHKTAFFLSLLTYVFYGIFSVLELKFLLLSFGVETTLTEATLALIVLGITNFIPVPAALGFTEAGQAGLFLLLKDSGSTGFAFGLLLRLRNIIFTIIGFSLISHFSGKEIMKRKEKILAEVGES